MMNVVNGGAHADNNVDVQEFMVVPCGAPSFREAVRWGAEVFHALKALLREGGRATAVGDEGGVAPDLDSNREAIELILRAVVRAGYPARPRRVHRHRRGELGVSPGRPLPFRGAGSLDAPGFASVLGAWADDFPVVSIEDGMAEDDWEGWAELTARLGDRVQLVGDDLFVTNPEISGGGYGKEWRTRCSSRVNQIGTPLGDLRHPRRRA